MKALVIKGVKEIGMIEKEKPVADERFSVIKVTHAGICGSDLHLFWAVGGFAGTNYVPGHEFAGVIEETLPGSGFEVGDRVVAMDITPCGECEYCKSGRPQLCDMCFAEAPGVGGVDGGYAEYSKVRNDFIRKLPDNISLKHAAMIEPVCISYHGVNMGNVNENSNVLVTGGGAIGLFAAAAAKAKGAKYVALTEANPGRIKIAEEADFVDEVFDAADSEIGEKVKAKVPEGFDVSIECSGHPAAANLALYSLKRGGQHAILAYGPGFKYDAMAIINNELHIHGSVMFTVPEFEEVIAFMSEGKIDVEKYGELIAMEEAQATFEGLENGTRPAVKYIYDMSK
jgi:2-desacetyl-2-hydroxyethyl bacteriochlorophyllide A dehydrogenase